MFRCVGSSGWIEAQLEEVQTWSSADSAESKVNAVATQLGDPLSSLQPAETTQALATLKLFSWLKHSKEENYFRNFQNDSGTKDIMTLLHCSEREWRG